MIRWLTRKGCDVYHALAAFNLAEVSPGKNNGEPITVAKREQANVQAIRTLVIDADVKRPGDNKKPDTVFPDQRSAVAWLLKFCTTIQLPLPNLAISSGYGIHFYWILENPLSLSQWQPLAEALKAAMRANSWPGDTSPTVDAARILRPPGTQNFKGNQPAPVEALDKFTAADYPNQQIVTALTPWIGLATVATGTGPSATVTPLGPRPAHLGGLNLNAAAHEGIERREYRFAHIAQKCEQVKISLANGGNGDPYPLWYRDNLTLTVFCVDGDDFVHPISAGDPRYKQAETDAAIARIKIEVRSHALGAPRCSSFDNDRSGVCQKCPFFGKLNSPISLGVEDGDLPDGYRRSGSGATARLEHHVGSGDKAHWAPLFAGDVHGPRVDELLFGGFQLSFNYELAGRVRPVAVKGSQLGIPHTLLPMLETQGMSLDRHNVGPTGDFAVAWITKLRSQGIERNDPLLPFGWTFGANGARLGLAIAGTHYRSDGKEERVGGGDPKVLAMYRPIGDMAAWRRAAALFEHQRPDLQTIIACSFGSPLVALCGDVRGMSFNFWSTASGIGKSSAIRIGQSVWGDYKGMQTMLDTPNAVMRSISVPRILVRYWDELRVSAEWTRPFVDLIYQIPQGKEKARMQSDTTLRETGQWEALVVFTSNRPYADLLVAKNDGTDSGLQRLFEIFLPKVNTQYDPSAGILLKDVETNYGHAGRIYAQWLATNVTEAQAILTQMMQTLTSSLAMQQEERFFVTAMSCVMAGAIIAKRLSLFDFDVKGIYVVLRDAFLEMRKQRSDKTLVSTQGQLDIEELLGQYFYATADYRLRTDVFSGRGGTKIDVRAPPRNNTVRIHIAESQSIMRISRREFLAWLHERGLPTSIIVDQLCRVWGAVVQRATLAGGTPWAGGQIWCIDIPLAGPLTHYATSHHVDRGAPYGVVRETVPGNEVRL